MKWGEVAARGSWKAGGSGWWAYVRIYLMRLGPISSDGSAGQPPDHILGLFATYHENHALFFFSLSSLCARQICFFPI